VKLAVSLLVAAACLFVSPALAQGSLGHYDAGRLSEPDTQVLGFIRIPLSQERQAKKDPVVGFGLFTDCSRSRSLASSLYQSACESEPIRSLEFSREFYERDWLLSFTGEKRWVGIARWFPNQGFARVREYGPVLNNEDRHYRVN
jgi:hypothetical protein